MAELGPKTPAAGLLPIDIGTLSLTEEDLGVVTSVAPFRGAEADLDTALGTAHDLRFPAPNRSTGRAGTRLIWFSHRHALLIGPAPDPSLSAYAALTDQSDAWTVVRLEGAGAEDVLARLVPVDLRRAAFKRGHTLRSDLMHMSASITRVGDMAFQIMVFRSMAKTLVHELKTAMEAVTARG